MELTPNFRFTEESHDVIKANLQKTHYGMFQQSIESHHSTIFFASIFFRIQFHFEEHNWIAAIHL